eukprot:2087243-Pyramimonas_sp.AAC.1
MAERVARSRERAQQRIVRGCLVRESILSGRNLQMRLQSLSSSRMSRAKRLWRGESAKEKQLLWQRARCPSRAAFSNCFSFNMA